MRTEQQCVREFMQKNAFTVDEKLGASSAPPIDGELAEAAGQMRKIAMVLKDAAVAFPVDHRVVRAFLMAEELAETIAAMATDDEVELADGLADLTYVVLGTAVKFSIPLHAVFHEVHRSNMTKTRGRSDDFLKAGKGMTYEPPDVRRAIDDGRASP